MEQHLACVVAALADGGDPEATAGEAGARLAREGAGLGEAMEALRRATPQRRGDGADGADGAEGGGPSFRMLQALAVGWAEEALGHALSRTCQDPLTGLAGPAHLTARLEEVYREADLLGQPVTTTHALVVVDMPRTTTTGGATGPTTGTAGAACGRSRLVEALGVLEVADRLRRVFPGEETLCRTGGGRLIVLARRTTDLGRDVARVLDLVDTLGRGPFRAVVEDLPGTVEGAAALAARLGAVAG